jgi:Flp pilus assembly protein TadG
VLLGGAGHDRCGCPRADVPRVGALAPPEPVHAQHPAPSDDHHEADHRCAVPLRGSEIDHMSPARRRLVLNVREERGATVVIVALVLIAMFGMMVLVVDVGGLLWKRRELVNGSDAAALSAARRAPFPRRSIPRRPKAAADPLAAQNVTGLDPTTTPNNATVLPGTCHTTASGGVKVQYSQQQHPVLRPRARFLEPERGNDEGICGLGAGGVSQSGPDRVSTRRFQGQCDISANLPRVPRATCGTTTTGSPTQRSGS